MNVFCTLQFSIDTIEENKKYHALDNILGEIIPVVLGGDFYDCKQPIVISASFKLPKLKDDQLIIDRTNTVYKICK